MMAWCIPSGDFMEGYEVGMLDGIELGRRQLEGEWAALDVANARTARAVAQAGPYDELADRRGQHDRAEQHRRIVRERGILPA